MTLAEFTRARLTEIEEKLRAELAAQAAQDAIERSWIEFMLEGVLRQVKELDAHEACGGCHEVRVMAAPFHQHPDFALVWAAPVTI